MRKLIVATCLIATICAYHIKKTDFNVVIDSVEYSNIPAKYHLPEKVILHEEFQKLLIPILKNAIQEAKIQPRSGIDANVNEYADKLFENIDNLIIHDGLDPVEMPDEHAGFNYTFIITYFGELDLTRGWLSDLSSVHRGGDVLVDYSHDSLYLEVTVPIAFDDLQFTYDYSASIMGLGPSGGLQGKVADVVVEVKIGFDVVTLQGSLDEFYITNSGHIDLNFNGNSLVDWLVNLLTDVVTTLLKPVILLIVEDIIRGGLNGIIQDINDGVNGLLNPTTPAPGVTADALFFN